MGLRQERSIFQYTDNSVIYSQPLGTSGFLTVHMESVEVDWQIIMTPLLTSRWMTGTVLSTVSTLGGYFPVLNCRVPVKCALVLR